MKIGIITIIDKNNYGNRLQNYALSKVLSRYGIVNTIINYPEYDFPFPKNYIKRLLFKLHILKKILKKELTLTRINNFSKFNNNISFVSKNKSLEYDYFVVGSDQVWNPYYRLTNMDVLKGYEKNKCISYAASFGISEIKDKDAQDKIKNEIGKFKNLSVREEKGKEIIKDICDREDVEVNIDPTMLLTQEEWDAVSKKPQMLKTDKFILNYFLGELSESRKKEIEKIAQDNGCEIINILDSNSPYFGCGPSEFLYLEKNAFLICTDSFHSSVFAILYNRPFVIFDREEQGVASMNSRLDTLINKFKLKNRKYNEKSITKENLEHDYTEAYKILEKEREKSKNFLNQSIK